jgi:folate-binding protein YgfZ
VTARLAHRRRTLGVLAVAGVAREAFLQGQLTQDARGLRDREVRRMAGLTPKGKLVYFGWLVGERDRALLLVPHAARDAARTHLARFAVFQKVSVEDATDAYAAWSLYGPTPPELPAAAGAALLPAEGEMSGGLLAPHAEAARVEAALTAAGSREMPAPEAEVLRIEAGRPRFGVDADETNLPDEIGLSDAISTTKGCYVGQEVVARLRTYGRVSRRLAGFRLEGGAAAGAVFPDPGKPSRELARVTSAADSPRFGPIGIGMASRDVPEGAALSGPDGIAARVVALPFS